LARLVVMKKGGGGKVAINPELVTHVKSATGAFTDVFLDGQQVAIEATFEEVVAQLSDPHRRSDEMAPGELGPGQRGLVFNPAQRTTTPTTGRAGHVAGFSAARAMIAAALQIAAAFNLICTGTARTGPLGLALPEAGGAPYAITYRIDLDGNSWCSDACDATQPLVSASAEEIVLRETHAGAGSHVIRFLPGTLRFTDTLIVGDTATLRSGVCEAEAFSGFSGRVA